jgi:error-prone DNA polymerase
MRSVYERGLQKRSRNRIRCPARFAQQRVLPQLGGHRRNALWQVEGAGKLERPSLSDWLENESETQPACQMDTEERVVADYAGASLTVDKPPMYRKRPKLQRRGILTAEELPRRKDGEFVKTDGYVIARQRPGRSQRLHSYLNGR